MLLIRLIYRDLDEEIGIESPAELSDAEEDIIDSSGGHSAYGEISIEATEKLLALFEGMDTQRGSFYDLGSGLGKLALHMWLLAGCESVGTVHEFNWVDST
eukprot:m.218293 g.218293  ORF g.218293 m.218293 type:complete len:101 (-) comp19148_c0_seq2:24-326(-)